MHVCKLPFCFRLSIRVLSLVLIILVAAYPPDDFHPQSSLESYQGGIAVSYTYRSCKKISTLYWIEADPNA